VLIVGLLRHTRMTPGHRYRICHRLLIRSLRESRCLQEGGYTDRHVSRVAAQPGAHVLLFVRRPGAPCIDNTATNVVLTLQLILRAVCAPHYVLGRDLRTLTYKIYELLLFFCRFTKWRLTEKWRKIRMAEFGY
jgi:hypothetical protein